MSLWCKGQNLFLRRLCWVSIFIEMTGAPSWTLAVWRKSIDFFFSLCLNLLLRPLTSTESFPVRDFPACASLADNRKIPPSVPLRCRPLVMFYFLDLIAVNSCMIQRLYSLSLSTWHLPHYLLLPPPQTRTKPKQFLVGSREKWQRRSHGGAAVSSDHVTVRYAEKLPSARARTPQR